MAVKYGDSWMSFKGSDMGTVTSSTAGNEYQKGNDGEGRSNDDRPDNVGIGMQASDKKTVGLHFELLDNNIAPIEKQIRIFVNGTEVPYNDTTALSRPTG